MGETIAIVGAGHCAGQAAATLRKNGHDGRIVVIGDEPHPPYQRPPLSKKFLSGELPIQRVYLRPPKFYAEHEVELTLGTRVSAIERDEHQLSFSNGDKLAYDRLLLATGSRPRTLDVPGTDLPGVFYLRTIADVERIRDHITPGKRLVVVGGGYIGLEVASIAVEAAMNVTILEMRERILERVTAPEVAGFFTRVHADKGADIHCSTRVTRFEGKAQVERVITDGQTFEADAVIIGVGIMPNVELAQAAGLACDNGIVVDERCRTGDERIYAAGDCTNHPNPILSGRRLRLESVHNALAQGKVVAANLTGKQKIYAEMPWFWSEQYDLILQMVGLSGAHDTVVTRGSVEAQSFTMFYLKDGAVIAADAVNSARDFMVCRQFVPNMPHIAPGRLADTDTPLKELAQQSAPPPS